MIVYFHIKTLIKQLNRLFNKQNRSPHLCIDNFYSSYISLRKIMMQTPCRKSNTITHFFAYLFTSGIMRHFSLNFIQRDNCPTTIIKV